MKSGQFAVCPARALDDTRMTNAAIRVLLNIARYADRNRRAFPSLATIGEQMGMTKQAVHKQVQLLVAWGYLTVETRERANGSRTSNGYFMVMDADLPKEFDRGEPGEEYDPPSVNPTLTDRLTPRLTGRQPPEVDASNRDSLTEKTPQVPKGDGSELFPEVVRITGAEGGQFLQEFETVFWPRFPKRDGAQPKKPAAVVFMRKRKQGAALDLIIAALDRDVAHWTAAGKLGTQFIPHASSWLNDEPWDAKAGAGAIAKPDLSPSEARDIRTFSQLEAVLRQHGLPMGTGKDSERRAFCLRNGIPTQLLNG